MNKNWLETQDYWTAIRPEWENIPQQELQQLVSSVLKCLQTVAEEEGIRNGVVQIHLRV